MMLCVFILHSKIQISKQNPNKLQNPNKNQNPNTMGASSESPRSKIRDRRTKQRTVTDARCRNPHSKTLRDAGAMAAGNRGRTNIRNLTKNGTLEMPARRNPWNVRIPRVRRGRCTPRAIARRRHGARGYVRSRVRRGRCTPRRLHAIAIARRRHGARVRRGRCIMPAARRPWRVATLALRNCGCRFRSDALSC